MTMNRILTFGVYDYFHLGHLRLFENCKKYGDYLIVAVQDGDYVLQYKPEAKILYSTQERMDMIKALRIVDEVVVYDSVCAKTLERIDFEILALGEDHRGGYWDSVSSWCETHGKSVVRLKRTRGIASSDIKKKLSEM